MLLPLQGALPRMPIIHGNAQGNVPVAPSGRIVHNHCVSYFFAYYKVFSTSYFSRT